MNIKPLFSLFVVLHVAALWYVPHLVSGSTATCGNRKLKQYVIYAIVFVCGIAPMTIQPWYLLMAAFLIFGHVIITIITPWLEARLPHLAVWGLIDPVLHIIVFVVVSVGFTSHGMVVSIVPWAKTILTILGVSGKEMVGWTAIFLLCGAPANDLIKNGLKPYRPVDDDAGDRANTGAFIGTLERVLIALLLGAQQYSAIGLVLSAKSIARYNKIATDKDFAEYYLLGTLFSTIIVIVVYSVFS